MTPDLNLEPLDAVTAFRATRRKRPARRPCRRAVVVRRAASSAAPDPARRTAPFSHLQVAAPWFAAGMAATSTYMLATGAVQWIAAAVALWAPLAAHRALARVAVGPPRKPL
jgi:hypothetical protein